MLQSRQRQHTAAALLPPTAGSALQARSCRSCTLQLLTPARTRHQICPAVAAHKTTASVCGEGTFCNPEFMPSAQPSALYVQGSG